MLHTDYYKAHGLAGEPRLIVSSLAANDLCTGLLILIFGVYPNLFQCWPMGETTCKVQVTQ